MSGDLISRSALRKNICSKECDISEFKTDAELNAFLLGLNAKQIAVMECLSDIPTAYDLDRICRRISEYKDMDNLLDADHAIKIVKSGECSEWLEAVADELESSAKPKWIPAEEPPKNDKYILLSFENFSVPQVGRYEEDECGGAYYLGDEEKSCISQDLIVNAWMPLPKAYREDEEEILECGQPNEIGGRKRKG